MLKSHEVISQVVPKYKELSVSKMWKEVKANPELMQYFPNYPNGQLPEREFMFSIISTKHAKELRDLVIEARKHRSITNMEDDEELIHISKEFMEEIRDVFAQKPTRGRVVNLLKKKSKFAKKRQKPKEYPAKLEMLRIEHEKKQAEDKFHKSNEDNMN